ncbi:MAG: DNA polymerase I [Prevotellaceae bacterium]|jgi:DNA polymerase-1|nr:DNA polymerase I [Prevotellaceae bacterium]
MKLFFLDAYALIYRAYYALIRNPRLNSKGLNTSAVFGFVNTLEDILKKEQPTHIGVAFDPKGPTFRHEMYAQYKAQREETPEDIRKSVPIIKEIIEAYRIPILEVSGYEADDVIGTLATQAGRQNDIRTYMMTPDKDYGQLVSDRVFIYRPKYGDKEYEIMGPEQVTHKYGIKRPEQIIDMLGLMGDASDNIPGCPGVGEKTAQKLIAEFGSIDNLLVQTDKLKGTLRTKIEEHAEQIRFSKLLATIKTDVPISLDMESLTRQEPDEKKLRALFEELEFRTLINRVLKRETNEPPAPKPVVNAPIQGDLFAAFQASPTNDAEKSQDFGGHLVTLDAHKSDFQSIKSDFFQKILTAETFAFFIETEGNEPMTAKLKQITFALEDGTGWQVTIPEETETSEYLLSELRPVFEKENIVKVGKNMKNDMILLRRHQINLCGHLFDTAIAHYVIQPEVRYQDELVGQLLDIRRTLDAELQSQGLTTLFYDIEMPLVPVLADMEYNGVRVDTQALQGLSEQFTARMKEIEEDVYRAAGMAFNIASPKQVGEILFDRLHVAEKPKKTKKGQYVTSEEVLESLRDKHPVIGKILAHRGLKKLLGTYVDALPLLINPQTGKIHTSFNQTVTATGRLSSSNPNLQNIPIRDQDGKEIRKAFIPDEGCTFFSADYSQIELRIMAHLSGDAHMIEAFQSGYDVHAATAAKIFKIPIDEVTSVMRRKAKTANFGIIYGISVFGLAQRMNVDRKEAAELIEGYFRTYPQIKAYMEKVVETARAQGYVETVFHRKRYLPDITSHNSVVRGYAERNAINAPIQGSAADIIKVAMVRIFERFRREGIRSKMILQVHDELNFSVPFDEQEQVKRIVIEEMENAYRMRVPLKADCGFGANWLVAH